jgi:hypothetical protein
MRLNAVPELEVRFRVSSRVCSLYAKNRKSLNKLKHFSSISYHTMSSTASASDRPRHSSFQTIKAPAREDTVLGNKSIFFSGSVKSSMDRDWQEELTASLAHLPVTIFNPRRVGIVQVVLASSLPLMLSSPTGMTPG